MPKPVWLGERKELTPRGSATEKQQRQIGLNSKYNPTPLVPSPRQRSAGRGLRRGEIANSQCEKRTHFRSE